MKNRCVALTLALVCLHTQACGPYFDYTYIVAASPKGLFRLPELFMAVEVEKLPADTSRPGTGSALPEGVTLRSLCGLKDPYEEGDYWEDSDLDETTAAELIDLYTALTQSGTSPEEATAICQKYYIIRFGFDERLNTYSLEPAHLSIPEFFTTLSQLPKEFYLYFEGAVAFHNWRYDEAVAHFEALLALPPEERKFRTTWALFMLGRISVTCQRESYPPSLIPELVADPQPLFDQLRTAAAEGAIDTLNLAGGTYQQEALLASSKGDIVGEIQALAHHALVSDQETAASALKSASLSLAAEEGIAPEIMADRLCRSVLAAFAATHVLDYPEHSERVLNAFQASDLELTPYESGRLAWTAYTLGDFAKAANLLALAPEDAYSLWTHSRLHLREGNVEGALAALSKAAPQFPREEVWSAPYAEFVDPRGPHAALSSEQGVLMLTRDRYVEALDMFLSGGNWVDAAFVAENVLTLSELQIYFKKCREEGLHQRPVVGVWLDNLYESGPDYNYSENYSEEGALAAPPAMLDRLGALIGRRMLREGQFDGAGDYYPERWKPVAQAYALHSKTAAGNGKKADRAHHLAQAGHLLRHWGIELIGREVDPDFAYTEGAVYYGSTAELRQDLAEWIASENGTLEDLEEEYVETGAPDSEGTPGDEGETMTEEEPVASEVPIDFSVLNPTAQERKRLARHQAQPYQRWHYRYTASRLFQEAAELLPAQSEQKAQALFYGAMVLKKVSGNEEALAEMDKCYKALVRTCGNLEIGRAANARRWFPEEPEDWADQFNANALIRATAEVPLDQEPAVQ